MKVDKLMKKNLWSVVLLATFLLGITLFNKSAQADTPFTGTIPAGTYKVPNTVYYGCFAFVTINGTFFQEGIRRDPDVKVGRGGSNPMISDIIVATNQTIADAAMAFCDASKWASIIAKMQVHVNKHAKSCVKVHKHHFVRNGHAGHDHHQAPVQLCPAPAPTPTTGCVDSGKGNIQITSTSISNYPGLTATSPYYGKVTVNYKNIGGTFCKAPVFSFHYKGIFSNAIANGGPASNLTTTLANQTGTTIWQFGKLQTGVDCSTTSGSKNTQIEIGITPTTSSRLTLPVTIKCP